MKSGFDIARKIRSVNDWKSIIIVSSSHNQKSEFICVKLAIFTYVSKLIDFENKMVDAFSEALDVIVQKNTLSIKTEKIIFRNKIII